MYCVSDKCIVFQIYALCFRHMCCVLHLWVTINLAILTVFKSKKTQYVLVAEFVTQSDEIILHSKSLFLFKVDKKVLIEAHFTIKLLTG